MFIRHVNEIGCALDCAAHLIYFIMTLCTNVAHIGESNCLLCSQIFVINVKEGFPLFSNEEIHSASPALQYSCTSPALASRRSSLSFQIYTSTDCWSWWFFFLVYGLASTRTTIPIIAHPLDSYTWILGTSLRIEAMQVYLDDHRAPCVLNRRQL